MSLSLHPRAARTPSTERSAADAAKVLETIVTECEMLATESPNADRGALIELHGALLAYELGGDADRLPQVRLGLSSRRLLELRVVRAARRIASGRDAASACELASARVADLIHLIDPELRALVA